MNENLWPPGSLRDTWPEALKARPVCPKRGLPIPFIAEVGDDGVGHFTILDNEHKEQCLKYRLCAMCSGPMGEEIALVGDVVSLDPGGFFIEPPIHEGCAEIALGGLCPYLSHQRVPRRPLLDDKVAVIGDPGELVTVGREIAKRPMIVAITQTYRPALIPTSKGSLTMIYQPGRVLRVRRFEWSGGRAVEVQPRPQRPVVRTQRRRKPRSKR